MTAEVIPLRGRPEHLHRNLNDLIHLAVSLGTPRFMIHEGAGVRFFNRRGREVEWATPDTPQANEDWSSPQAIDHLKRLAAISHPLPMLRQEGAFIMDIHVGGVTETVGVHIHTIPAEDSHSGEIVCGQMALKPWIPAWGRAALRLGFPAIAFVLGMLYPVPFVLAWGLVLVTREAAMAVLPLPSPTRRLRNRVVSLGVYGLTTTATYGVGSIIMGYLQGWEGPSPGIVAMILCPLLFFGGSVLCRFLRYRRVT